MTMKKMFLIGMVLALFAGTALAASTLVCTQKMTSFSGLNGYLVTCTATADGTAYTTLQLKDSAGTALNLEGQFLYMVTAAPGGTGPTDNSDLEILEMTASGYDILGGIGLNMIDNATTNSFRPTVNSVAAAVPIYGPLFVKASGNSVSTAIFVLTMRFVPRIP
jgi:hypothetical protein